jgi:hypothetical protein
MLINLYDHQLEAIEKMKNGCVLKGGVGTGKSRTAIAYYYTKVCGGTIKTDAFTETKEMTKPMDLYIITTAKKRDKKEWEGECAPFILSTTRAFSMNEVEVKVDSWNNLKKYIDVENAFFIFDEQRLVGSGNWVKSFLKIAQNNKWIVLSATPGDTWMDYVPIFIANGYYRNRTEFIRTHVVYNNFSKFPKIDRYIEQGRLIKYRREVLVEMPYERHTTRNVQDVVVQYDKDAFQTLVEDRYNIFEDRPCKDINELFLVMRKIVNMDPSRFEAVIDIVQKHKKVIIFYNFNYELDILRMLGPALKIPLAEWNGHKHEEIPETDEWVYLVQYAAGSEGWNCVETDATVFYSLNYSYKINEQAKGRIDRLNTKFVELYYYILRSESLIDNAILKALKNKQNFQGLAEMPIELAMGWDIPQ